MHSERANGAQVIAEPGHDDKRNPFLV